MFAKWDDGVALGMVAEEAAEAFVAATFPVQLDSQGRIVVHKTLRAFASLTGPVIVVARASGWACGPATVGSGGWRPSPTARTRPSVRRRGT